MKALIIGNDLNQFMAYTDSTIGRDAMPLFVPEDDGWCLEIGLAFRIGRLGKNIKEKFALRYIDSVSALVRVYQEDNKDKAWNCILDNSIVPGKFIPWCDQDITLDGNGTAVTYSCDEMLPTVSKAVSDITKISTIKTGDLIIPLEYLQFNQPLVPESLLQVCLNGEQVIKLKIK